MTKAFTLTFAVATAIVIAITLAVEILVVVAAAVAVSDVVVITVSVAVVITVSVAAVITVTVAVVITVSVAAVITVSVAARCPQLHLKVLCAIKVTSQVLFFLFQCAHWLIARCHGEVLILEGTVFVEKERRYDDQCDDNYNAHAD